MAHSYVLSFESERGGIRVLHAGPTPTTPCCWSTPTTRSRGCAGRSRHPRRPVAAAGVRLDSGDLAALAREARGLLDERARGDADRRLGRPRGAPDRGDVPGGRARRRLGRRDRARHQPRLAGGQRRLQDRRRPLGRRRLARRGQALRGKETLPGAKQVFRRFQDGGDVRGRRRPPRRRSSKASRCWSRRCESGEIIRAGDPGGDPTA